MYVDLYICTLTHMCKYKYINVYICKYVYVQIFYVLFGCKAFYMRHA